MGGLGGEVGFVGEFGGGEKAEVDFLALVVDLSRPFLCLFVERNSFMTRSVIYTLTHILLVLRLGGFTKIAYPIMMLNLIFMV